MMKTQQQMQEYSDIQDDFCLDHLHLSDNIYVENISEQSWLKKTNRCSNSTTTII